MVSLKNLVIVFTGFRDPKLKAAIESKGGRVASSVSGKTSVVVVLDEKAATRSTKISDAERRGIPVVSLTRFLQKTELGKKKRKKGVTVPDTWGFVNPKYDTHLSKIAAEFVKHIKSKRSDVSKATESTKLFLEQYLRMDCPDEDVTDTVIRDNVFDFVQKVTGFSDDTVNSLWDECDRSIRRGGVVSIVTRFFGFSLS